MSIKKKSNKRGGIFIAIIIIGIIAAAVFFNSDSEPALYESVKAKTGDITTYYHFSGNVETQNRQSIISDKVMQISDIFVEEGEEVEEGDVILKTSYGEEIESKINGEVATIHVEEDQQVMAAAPLVDIIDYENMEITVKVDEYDLSAIETDMDATVNISAIQKEIKGKIKSISKEGQIENGVTFYTAIIDLEKDESIKIGMSAEVKILSDDVKDVMTLPVSAIQFDENNEAYVEKKNENGEIYKEKIEIGINDGTTVEVKKGVSSDETVYYMKTNPLEGMVIGGNGGGNGINGGER